VQSRRHAQIARLLGIHDYVLAVNKMDLVDFDRSVFDEIVDEFDRILPNANLHPIPLSALHGDNVITRSERTPWFDGMSLLEFLETVEVEHDAVSKPFRMPVQLVLRPTHEFRGYAGQILTGVVSRGDAPTPAEGEHVERRTWDGELDQARAGQSVTLTLAERSTRRGDMITVGEVEVGQRFRARCRVDGRAAARSGRVYLLKHTTRTVTAEVDHGLAEPDRLRHGLDGAAAHVRPVS
jgi:sulfate adenylyltransferase subunit 1 (EFTu-like GTPase family)